MLKKFKKYFLLIPLLIVSLFNCVCYGQVIAAEDNIFISDMPDNYIDPHTDLQMILDIRDFTDYLNVDFPDLLYDDYLYFAKCSRAAYDNLINGVSDQLTISFDLFDFSNNVEITSYDGFFYCRINRQGRTFKYTKSKNTFTLSSNSYSSKMHCYFNDDFSNYSYSSTSNNIDQAIDNSDTVILAIQSNVVEFSSSNLDVDVVFSPELTGAFNRTVLQNGQKVTLDTLNFTVTNNSTFPIQYMVAIVNRDEDFFVYNDNNSYSAPNGKVFGGNPSYVYVKDEWLYLPSGETKKNVTSTFAPSSWHYVSSKNSDSVTIGFNQMKLNIGVYYDVYVYAIRNDSNQVLCIPYNRDSWQYNEDYVIDFTSAELVYSSEFIISNPAIFDPTANDGSYAFDIDDRQLFNRANGYIDENGNVVIDRIDTDSLIGSSDSWGSQYDSDAWETYYTKQNTVSSDIDQLSRNFSSFFKFVNKFFSYFPKNYQSIIILGLTSMVVLGLFKVLI